MIFTLEALPARHGDSLVLHFGDADAPRFVVIDGGPSGVYKDALRPRLDKLAEHWSVDGKLEIELMMVSHIDDDHISGILELTEQLIDNQHQVSSPFRVRTLWHNAFGDVAGTNAGGAVAAVVAGAQATIAAAGGEAPAWKGQAQAVVASVSQGVRLRSNAEALGWPVNVPFGGLVSAPATGGQTVEHAPLRLTVLGPLQAQVDALRAEWAEQVARLQQAKDAKAAAEVAAYLDRSVFNLSSIVCLAEVDGKRMLLTGDAVGSKVLEGLERAGLMDDTGKIEVDVLKLPHHGSSRNVAPDFFERIRAKHYVASGNGKYDNPEPATLQMISAARPDDDFTLHLTYERFEGPIDAKIDAFLAQEKQDGRTYEVRRRSDADRSLRVDLLDPVEY